MRFLHLHTYLCSYSYSGSGFTTLWACICIALLFSRQADSSLAAQNDDLFHPDSNSNFFLDDDSSSGDFTGLLMEPQPILDDIALTNGLGDASDDECGINNVLPSSSSLSKGRLRARLTSDSCKNPNFVIEGVEDVKIPATAEQIKNTWCAGTKVPIPEFGNVPVCQETEHGIFSEYLLPEEEPPSRYFQTIFRGKMSKLFDVLI